MAPIFSLNLAAVCSTSTAMIRARNCLLALALLVATFAGADLARADLPVTPARVLHELPHDPSAFTEGLFIEKGELVESTGLEGRSSIRRVDLATGKVLASVNVPGPVFGEGVAPWHGTILSLTWRNGFGLRWQPVGRGGRHAAWLRPLGRFTYMGEGWALTGDGRQLIMSDGTDTLRFIEPGQFRVTRLLKVTAEGQPVMMLNELEYVDGEILADFGPEELMKFGEKLSATD